MRLVLRRTVSAFVALVLIVAPMTHVAAQTSGTVTVTGEIAASPLSITITNDTVNFGSIDSRGTAQTGGTVHANGFLADSDNGALWVALAPFSVTVDSPNIWAAQVCATSSLSGTSGLFRHMDTMPADAVAANAAFVAPVNYISGDCLTPYTWLSNQAAGVVTMTRYLGFWVHDDTTLGTLNATITITVSN